MSNWFQISVEVKIVLVINLNDLTFAFSCQLGSHFLQKWLKMADFLRKVAHKDKALQRER